MKQARGLMVICAVLECPYMVMECVNAATVVTCIDLRSDRCSWKTTTTTPTHKDTNRQTSGQIKDIKPTN